MKEVSKKKTAYYHVMYAGEDLKFRYPGETCKNLTLTEAKTAMKERVARAVKNYRLVGCKATVASKTPTKIKLNIVKVDVKGWDVEGVVTYMIKKTANPVK